jgi:uncharacterized BrkB/YihY/UPF0761 family membrane protein
VALVLAASGGVLLAAGGLLLGAGQAIAKGAGWTQDLRATWDVVRWPLGLVVAAIGVFLVFVTAPRKRVASFRSLAAGAGTAVVLWAVFTALLGAYFAASGGSSTYGPLLAFIAVLVWAVLASLALHLGLAMAAELTPATALPAGRAADVDSGTWRSAFPPARTGSR